jgi:hypothetical protein
MTAQNLHRIMGSRFQHAKPGLCERCALRQPYGEWEGYCTARQKILSATTSTKQGRCPEFKKAE